MNPSGKEPWNPCCPTLDLNIRGTLHPPWVHVNFTLRCCHQRSQASFCSHHYQRKSTPRSKLDTSRRPELQRHQGWHQWPQKFLLISSYQLQGHLHQLHGGTSYRVSTEFWLTKSLVLPRIAWIEKQPRDAECRVNLAEDGLVRAVYIKWMLQTALFQSEFEISMKMSDIQWFSLTSPDIHFHWDIFIFPEIPWCMTALLYAKKFWEGYMQLPTGYNNDPRPPPKEVANASVWNHTMQGSHKVDPGNDRGAI